MCYNSIVMKSKHKPEHPDDPWKTKCMEYFEEKVYNPIELEMSNIEYKTDLKHHINSAHKHEPPADLSKLRYGEKVELMEKSEAMDIDPIMRKRPNYDGKVELLQVYKEDDHKMKTMNYEEDIEIPKTITKQSNPVNNVKEIEVKVNNPEEDYSVPNVKKHMKIVHNHNKSVKPNGILNETNLKKHIKHEPPNDLSNLENDDKAGLMEDPEMVHNCHKCGRCKICNMKLKNRTKLKKHFNDEHELELSDNTSIHDCHECGRVLSNDDKAEGMKDSDGINYDPIVIEICNIKFKHKINLEQHRNSAHKQESPPDLSDSENDDKAGLMKDSEMVYNCHKCGKCKICNMKFKTRIRL